MSSFPFLTLDDAHWDGEPTTWEARAALNGTINADADEARASVMKAIVRIVLLGWMDSLCVYVCMFVYVCDVCLVDEDTFIKSLLDGDRKKETNKIRTRKKTRNIAGAKWHI